MDTDGRQGMIRLCKLDGCPNELGSDVGDRGRHANVCIPCRRGETGSGRAYLERNQMSQQNQVVPPAPLPIAGVQIPAGAIEAKAKAIIPLARELEKKVRIQKTARSDAAASVNAFTRALLELRDAAKSLIES